VVTVTPATGATLEAGVGALVETPATVGMGATTALAASPATELTPATPVVPTLTAGVGAAAAADTPAQPA